MCPKMNDMSVQACLLGEVFEWVVEAWMFLFTYLGSSVGRARTRLMRVWKDIT